MVSMVPVLRCFTQVCGLGSSLALVISQYRGIKLSRDSDTASLQTHLLSLHVIQRKLSKLKGLFCSGAKVIGLGHCGHDWMGSSLNTRSGRAISPLGPSARSLPPPPPIPTHFSRAAKPALWLSWLVHHFALKHLLSKCKRKILYSATVA